MSSCSNTARRSKAARKRLLAKQEERVRRTERLAKSLNRPRDDEKED